MSMMHALDIHADGLLLDCFLMWKPAARNVQPEEWTALVSNRPQASTESDEPLLARDVARDHADDGRRVSLTVHLHP